MGIKTCDSYLSIIKIFNHASLSLTAMLLNHPRFILSHTEPISCLYKVCDNSSNILFFVVEN